ncbi:anthocyanidin 3-O-glucoside 2'''-O-xylosyltransferase-like [Amaranthus tricolor]|uniref:anthocyanidin 3-O-glucoside 2'''-O-xylosyltransferase-like n=1 Tax=Amaranthus tricolor TaxID=29722 RepID=UPI00258E4ABE|nr:anthocyanidin 3-O-glucoside 2'''-O-xylosyltransferase-like isoform X2 [Amaranthus tricolor]XP_057528883.1 anthocyanidin 3-O-glucoside 2'''-O-xylosyltransferase-like [Amaranthus tricolor]
MELCLELPKKLKPRAGYRTVEEAFPDGFIDRVGDRGVVIGEWIKEPLTVIINHPSIGSFVHHCGFGNMWDSVLVPQLTDQVMYSKLMCEELKLAVQVDRGQDGSWVSKQSLSKAILSVMDEGNQVGDFVRMNHEFWRQRILNNELMSNIDKFVKDLQVICFESA